MFQARLDQLASEPEPVWSWTEPGPLDTPETTTLEGALETFAALRSGTLARVTRLDEAGWSRAGTARNLRPARRGGSCLASSSITTTSTSRAWRRAGDEGAADDEGAVGREGFAMRIGVIGSGVIGLATAYNLAARGCDVVVIGNRAPGAGAVLEQRRLGGPIPQRPGAGSGRDPPDHALDAQSRTALSTSARSSPLGSPGSCGACSAPARRRRTRPRSTRPRASPRGRWTLSTRGPRTACRSRCMPRARWRRTSTRRNTRGPPAISPGTSRRASGRRRSRATRRARWSRTSPTRSSAPSGSPTSVTSGRPRSSTRSWRGAVDFGVTWVDGTVTRARGRSPPAERSCGAGSAACERTRW